MSTNYATLQQQVSQGWYDAALVSAAVSIREETEVELPTLQALASRPDLNASQRAWIQSRILYVSTTAIPHFQQYIANTVPMYYPSNAAQATAEIYALAAQVQYPRPTAGEQLIAANIGTIQAPAPAPPPAAPTTTAPTTTVVTPVVTQPQPAPQTVVYNPLIPAKPAAGSTDPTHTTVGTQGSPIITSSQDPFLYAYGISQTAAIAQQLANGDTSAPASIPAAGHDYRIYWYAAAAIGLYLIAKRKGSRRR